MEEITQIYSRAKEFYDYHIICFGEGWDSELKLPDIIHRGRHIKWIEFKNYIKCHRTDIADNLQNSSNINITINIIRSIFTIYGNILSFIEERRTDIPEDLVIDTSREGIAIELKYEILETLNFIHMICPESEVPAINKSDITENIGTSISFPMAPEIFAQLAQAGYIRLCENGKYEWLKSAKLYGYFVDLSSIKFNLRPSNNRIPWKIYSTLFVNHNKLKTSASQGIQDYKNKDLCKPEGYEFLHDLCS